MDFDDIKQAAGDRAQIARFRRSFGLSVRRFRRISLLTVDQLASVTGISARRLQAVEDGVACVELADIFRLAKAFDASPSEVTDWSNDLPETDDGIAFPRNYSWPEPALLQPLIDRAMRLVRDNGLSFNLIYERLIAVSLDQQLAVRFVNLIEHAEPFTSEDVDHDLSEIGRALDRVVA